MSKIQTPTGANIVYDASFNGAVVKRSAGGAAMSDTMPDPGAVGGSFKMTIINQDSTAAVSLLTPNGIFDESGAATYSIPAGMGVAFECDGTNWTTFIRTFPS